jgi:hypothetical protein
MDLIYGNAMFTICAADGPDASVGLLAMDEISGTGNKDKLIAACKRDVKLMISRPPETYIEASIWKKRAWTSKNDCYREDVLTLQVEELVFSVNPLACQRIYIRTERVLAGPWTLQMRRYRLFSSCLCDHSGFT